MTQYLYTSEVFNVDNIEAAKKIILTAEGSPDEEVWETEKRWEKETPAVVELIIENSRPHENSVVLDYGCGIGRIAKELIAQTGCKVIGVDISPNMRALSDIYVDDPRFAAISPDMLPALVKTAGLHFHSAYAIWVLQHVAQPEKTLREIWMALNPDAPFCVLNNIARAVPIIQEGKYYWAEDHKNINELTLQFFSEIEPAKRLSTDFCPQSIHDYTYWKVYKA